MSTKMRKVKGFGYGLDHQTEDAMLPSFSVTEKDLPAIKDWKIGGKYKLEIEVEQVDISKSEYGDSKLRSRLKIHKIGEKALMSEKEKQGRMGYY